MGGTKGIFSEGSPADYRDIQRVADAAATADQIALGALVPSRTEVSNARGVMPLLSHYGVRSYVSELLVVPSATTGRLAVRPAAFVVYDVADNSVTTPALVAYLTEAPVAATSTAVTANSSGSVRFDALYATVQWETSETDSRPFRDANGVSTQTLDLAKTPTVTLTLLAGTPGGGYPVLPSDGASAYNVLLAYVRVANGYTLNGSIDQLAGGGASAYIVQAWSRVGIPEQRLTANTLTTGSLLSRRVDPPSHHYAPVLHTANPQTETLVDRIDGRGRVIRIRGTRPALDTTYKNPTAVTKGGCDSSSQFDSGVVFTGTNGDATHPCYSTSGIISPTGRTPSTITLTFWGDSDGIWVKFAGDLPVGTSDAWWFEIDVSGYLPGAVPE